MNRIYKTVWSAVRGCVAVVSELCGACGSCGKRVKNAGSRGSVSSGERGRFVPSALVMALAGVFVSEVSAAAGFNLVTIHADAPTASGEWKTLDLTLWNPDLENLKIDMAVLKPLLTSQEGEKYLNTVYGAKLKPDLIQGGSGGYAQYEADAGTAYVDDSFVPEDLNFTAENWPVDEMGLNGIAGNFTVEDGKTLTLFGEAPLNGSYLGEEKTGTVRDGTLVFGLPYKFSEFKDGLSSGDTGALVLEDGANVEFRNGVYSTSRIDIKSGSSVRIVVKDSADVTMQCGDFHVIFHVIDALADGEGSVGVIENVGSGALTISDQILFNASEGGAGTISNT